MGLKMLSLLFCALMMLGSLSAEARARSEDDPSLNQGRSRGSKTEAVSLEGEAPGCPCKDQTRIGMLNREHTAITPTIGGTQPGAQPKGPGNAEQGQ